MSESTLFKPSNGKFYQRSDYSYVCKQQPLLMDELPEYLHTFGKWTPPKLFLAWPSDQASLLKRIERVYPSSVIRNRRGELVQTTLGALPKAIRKDFAIDPDFHDCLQVVTVALENGKHAISLAVGCTHIGMLNANLIGDIQAKLGYEESPKWYIDPNWWTWRERRAFVFPSFLCMH
ncbi:hypothetical protein BDZ89DRAFT_1037391 [Hymenopellis radicata]|nr:hypothetical protein BDZ89DRAFT_1037391 [Hymenopellis radicata]